MSRPQELKPIGGARRGLSTRTVSGGFHLGPGYALECEGGRHWSPGRPAGTPSCRPALQNIPSTVCSASIRC